MALHNSKLISALILWLGVMGASGQSPAQSAASIAPGSTYSFQTTTRTVLVDVTVTDTKGNAVHGLPQSAFKLFDNKQAQQISSFEEHSSSAASSVPAATTTGTFSNDYLLHLAPVVNILLIDITSLTMPEQMYLNFELTRYLNEKSRGQPLAIYLRAGADCFLVQGFTSDRKLLLDSLHRAFPRFSPHGPLTHLDGVQDLGVLHDVAGSVGQLPARKNILWFSGGSLEFSNRRTMAFENYSAWRGLANELEEDRIAVYPIDARALISVELEASMVAAQQRLTMANIAKVTGGQAYYGRNNLKEITRNILDGDNSFYTLTYSPHGLRLNKKWHQIGVDVDGATYNLSFRRGYFAEGDGGSGKAQSDNSRTHLVENGEKGESDDSRNQPIIFKAAVDSEVNSSGSDSEAASGSSAPAGVHKKDSVLVAVRYTVPLNALTTRVVDGKQKVVVDVVAIGLDGDGSMKDHKIDQIVLSLPEDVRSRNPDLPVVLDQQIELSKEDRFLHLGVWDPANGRFGVIDVPFRHPTAE